MVLKVEADVEADPNEEKKEQEPEAAIDGNVQVVKMEPKRAEGQLSNYATSGGTNPSANRLVERIAWDKSASSDWPEPLHDEPIPFHHHEDTKY
uniref:Expressed conserved protein n=1 Tax=Echinococcus granulosus TaxID=6210 RepID=A0A068WY31_ECHGR|nr:hypothetical protein EgrG_002056900 [Echinococcus granulosus]